MRDRKTYVRRLLTATAVILLLLAGAPAAATQSAQEPAAELERFYSQDLTFGSCEDFATTAIEAQLYVDPFECSRLEVPLNYDQPEGDRSCRLSLLPDPEDKRKINHAAANGGSNLP